MPVLLSPCLCCNTFSTVLICLIVTRTQEQISRPASRGMCYKHQLVVYLTQRILTMMLHRAQTHLLLEISHSELLWIYSPHQAARKQVRKEVSCCSPRLGAASCTRQFCGVHRAQNSSHVRRFGQQNPALRISDAERGLCPRAQPLGPAPTASLMMRVMTALGRLRSSGLSAIPSFPHNTGGAPRNNCAAQPRPTMHRAAVSRPAPRLPLPGDGEAVGGKRVGDEGGGGGENCEQRGWGGGGNESVSSDI